MPESEAHNTLKQAKGKSLNLNLISNKRLVVGMFLAFYFAFILISRIPIIAQDDITANMEDSYTYHLTYKYNGRQGHYYVERYEYPVPFREIDVGDASEPFR